MWYSVPKMPLQQSHEIEILYKLMWFWLHSELNTYQTRKRSMGWWLHRWLAFKSDFCHLLTVTLGKSRYFLCLIIFICEIDIVIPVVLRIIWVNLRRTVHDIWKYYMAPIFYRSHRVRRWKWVDSELEWSAPMMSKVWVSVVEMTCLFLHSYETAADIATSISTSYNVTQSKKGRGR